MTDEGYPALTCGTTDKQRHFHPFGIGLAFNETEDDFAFFFDSIKQLAGTYAPEILIADNAPAITHAYERAFKLVQRVNCWAHVIRNIDDHLKGFECKDAIRKDLLEIQVSPTEQIFKKSIELFMRKYSAPSLADFLKYFKANWVDKNSNWWEGYARGLPSTSNSLESFHLNGIKSKNRIKQRLPAIQFLNAIIDVVENWSLDRAPTVQGRPNPNLRIYATKPELSRADWQNAFIWDRKGKSIVKLNNVFYIPRGEKETLNKNEVRDYLSVVAVPLKQTDKLADWLAITRSVHVVNINNDKNAWELSTCSCWWWQKHFLCNHVISIASRLGLCDFEKIAMLMPLERRRGPGRKKKTAAALQRQSVGPASVPADIIEEDSLVEAAGQTVCRSRTTRRTAMTSQRRVVEPPPEKRSKNTTQSQI